jgi:hypothetical protein
MDVLAWTGQAETPGDSRVDVVAGKHPADQAAVAAAGSEGARRGRLGCPGSETVISRFRLRAQHEQRITAEHQIRTSRTWNSRPRCTPVPGAAGHGAAVVVRVGGLSGGGLCAGSMAGRSV